VLGTLIEKEIRGHILSFRFLAIFVLLLVVVPVTVLILTNDTLRRQDEYSRRQTDIQEYLSRYAHFNRLQNVIRPSEPPLPLQALVRGLSDDTGLGSFDDDPLPIMFPLIDLTFIVTILLSLAALILSHDALSGEREDGTLKLMLANGVPRFKIVLGKTLGGTGVLGVSFIVALALGMILLLLNPRLGWKGGDGAALAVIVAASILFIGFFYGLGVLISSRHASSASSILTSLFVWVLLVLVVPNLSPYVASLLRPAPSAIKVGREVRRLTDVERDQLGTKLSAEKRAAVVKALPILEGVGNLSEQDVQERIRRDPAFSEAYATYRKEGEAAWAEANRIQNGKAKILNDDLGRKETAQTALSRGLSMISPLAAFSYLATDLSGTGLRGRVHFGEIAGAWWRDYNEYSQKKMAEMRRGNPTMDLYNTAVDVHDMPRFVYREEVLSDRVLAALASLALLAGLALAVFVAGVLAFNRADVR